MGDTEKQSLVEVKEQSCVSSSTTPINNTTSVTSTPSPNTPTGTQATSTLPLANMSLDRQAVQVIQQTLHRPQSMTAQYLQQMYAAQQQHILLQTAALQQQHQQNITATQILNSTQPASQSNGRQLTSSPPATNGNGAQLTNVAQTSITIPTSSANQPIGRVQANSTGSTGGAVSQQTMILGNNSPTGSQAQMYLRTQMLILTPAATVAAVQPDLTLTSSQSAASQVQSLALRTNLPGSLAAPHNIQIKPSPQGQTLVTPFPKMSICPLKSTQMSQNLIETSRSESHLSDVSQPPSAHSLIAPSTFSPVQSHAMVRHQLHCTPSQRVAPHQLIIQQSAAAQRHVQPIAMRVTPPPLSLQTRTTPSTATVQSQHGELLSVTSSTNRPANQVSVQQHAIVSTSTLPDPPPLHLGPVFEPVSQYSSLSCPPPLTMALPRLMHPPRLSLRSVQTVAVQSDRMLVSDEELPVAEALVQLPFQNLPPPQTVAVDLKLQPTAPTEAPSATRLKESENVNDLVKDPSRNRTPTPPPTPAPQTSSDDIATRPENYTADQDQPCVPSAIHSEEDPSYANGSPPPLLSSAVRSSGRFPPASLPENREGQTSQAIVRPHILTHLIEGFVIREGLEPFPARRVSLEMDMQATLPEDGESVQDDCLMDVDQPGNSSDSDIENPPADDDQTIENEMDVLECEFCGKRGFAHTFLRSKRFCSMTCVKRFSGSCKKRLNLLRADKLSRWPHRPMGRRGRPPSRINSGSREHFFRKKKESRPTDDSQRVSNSSVWIERDEDPPGPMTTRLRLQTERGKERDTEREQSHVESSDCFLDSSPSQWSVENVCSFIASLPGCHDIARDFRLQEIDGQALLLLTEDHLMSAMNIKLGPALKICAQINALKAP